MLTVGPRIMSRPSAFTSWAMAWPSRWTRAISHVEAIATPEGNEVVSTLTGFVEELVIAELPVQERTPIGPSAILIAGMPRRGMGADSIQPEPESMVAFSSRVMRLRRSCTRWSTGRDVSLSGDVAGEVGAVCAGANTTNKKENTSDARQRCNVRQFIENSRAADLPPSNRCHRSG